MGRAVPASQRQAAATLYRCRLLHAMGKGSDPVHIVQWVMVIQQEESWAECSACAAWECIAQGLSRRSSLLDRMVSA